ncbi:uncharacterized protein EDB93DRAFT_1253124 [Suillus bovinus]|uniref:uncharacterized protein n=1 Tax=Suillus bovinus TaxID=48563 RepID=UPI001B879825|nr:uncharacterized protein EDB93DRAFT_1253124 [Suillus bovinus]KAG2139192.1 hypothetical protein EDB93DRAFT_1253124 [Suillus bovinus]
MVMALHVLLGWPSLNVFRGYKHLSGFVDVHTQTKRAMDGSQVRPSKQSDMYSFGDVMLQVLTNNIPYYNLRNDAAIIWAMQKSQKPSRSRYPELPEIQYAGEHRSNRISHYQAVHFSDTVEV